MEKENLDDLMRQKFDTDAPGARFEFREEYWEQAQALIEADERRRKRRFLWWWWFGGLLLAGGGGLFWYGGGQTDYSADDAVQVTSPARKNNEVNDRDSNDTNAESNEWPTGKRAIDAKTTTPKSSRVTDASGSRLHNAATTTGPLSSHASDAASGSTIVSSKTKSGIATRSKNESAESAGIPANRTTDKPPQLTPSSTDAGMKDVSAANPGSDTLETSASTAPVNSLLAPLPPIDFQMYTFLPRILFFPRAAPDREIKPQKTSRFKVDLNAAATYYDTRENTPWFGGAAGASAEYRFYQQFRVFAGAAWRYIPTEKLRGIDTISNFTSGQRRYSFGYEQNYQTIRLVALHALEFPIGLRWRWNAIAVEAGIAPSRLIAVRANLLSSRQSSLEPPDLLNPLIEQKKIWIDFNTERYRQTWISSFAGIEWGTGRLKLSVRGFRMPGNVLPKQHFLSPPQKKYLFGAEAGLRWRFSE